MKGSTVPASKCIGLQKLLEPVAYEWITDLLHIEMILKFHIDKRYPYVILKQEKPNHLQKATRLYMLRKFAFPQPFPKMGAALSLVHKILNQAYPQISQITQITLNAVCRLLNLPGLIPHGLQRGSILHSEIPV